MNRWLKFLPWLLIAIAGATVWLQRSSGQPTDEIVLVCANLNQGCALPLPGAPRIQVTGTLKPLSPFTVHLTGISAHSARIRFSMEGMEMGFNLYTLHPAPGGGVAGQVTLPVCVTGRRDWRMHIELDEARFSLPFVTDL